MKAQTPKLVGLVLVLVLLTTACGGRGQDEEPTPDASDQITITPTAMPANTPGPVVGVANVDSIQVLVLESFPVQINVVARGELPDGCTSIDDIDTVRSGTDFQVSMTTFRPAEAVCTEAVVPFEESIALDVLGLDAGAYTVTVNGISGSFTLEMDNRIAEEAAPTPEPAPVDSAVIQGLVWHDLCAVGGVEGDEAAEGCVANPDDGFQANGLLDTGEPGIANVLVSLGEGACPATGLATASTDASGEFTFLSLAPGTYCVSVDPLDETNGDILLPGAFTFPDLDLGSETVNLEPDQNLMGINFGWDYQFLPIPDVDFATCTNIIQFVEDVNVPDDTVFAQGQSFTKSWRLRNNGTCPWTTDYSLVFVGGDALSDEESIPLPSVVAPGQTVDLSVDLVAPEELGTYRSNWQLSDLNGQPFGVGGLIEEAFWVQIVVAEAAATPQPSSAVIGGVVWDDICFLLDDGTPSADCVERAAGSNVFIGDGSYGVRESPLAEIVVNLSTDACPVDGFLNPSSVIQTATTDEDGLYRFTGLDQGIYCVSISAFSDDNVNLLIPGDWTWPFPGVGWQGINLAGGEERLDVDFGWDFQ